MSAYTCSPLGCAAAETSPYGRKLVDPPLALLPYITPMCTPAEYVRSSLPNNLVDTTTSAWLAYKDGFEIEYDSLRTPTSQYSITMTCDDPKGKKMYGAYQIVHIDQQAPAPLLIMGWGRSTAVLTPGGDAFPLDYSIYMDVTFADGDHEWKVCRSLDRQRFLISYRSRSIARAVQNGNYTQKFISHENPSRRSTYCCYSAVMWVQYGFQMYKYWH